MPRQPASVPFPVKGLDEGWAYRAQPEGTTPDCLNVRAYDALGQRLRGGQRPGLSRFFATQPNGAQDIQMLVQEPIPMSGSIEGFAYPNYTFFAGVGSPWIVYNWNTWLSGTAGLHFTPNTLWVSGTSYAAGDTVVLPTGANEGGWTCVTPNSDVAFTPAKWNWVASPWLTGETYYPDSLQEHLGRVFIGVKAHTSGVFATDRAAGDWTLLMSAWITADPYMPGDLVVNGGLQYVCSLAHTSTIFADDLALNPSPWTLISYHAWTTGTAYKIGDQVIENGLGYTCMVAHTSGVFVTDLTAPIPKWLLFTPLVFPDVVTGNAFQQTDRAGVNLTAFIYQNETPTGDMTASITITDLSPPGVIGETGAVSLWVRVSDTTGYRVEYYPGDDLSAPLIILKDETGGQVFINGGLIQGFVQAWTTGGAAPGQLTRATPVIFTVSVVGADMRIFLNGVLVIHVPTGVVDSGGHKAGFSYLPGSVGQVLDLTNFTLSAPATGNLTGGRILTTSGGDIYSGDPSTGWLQVGSGMNATGIVRGQTAFGKTYLCDGVASHYTVYDPGTRTTIPWTPTIGSLPVGQDPSIGATIIVLYRGRIVLSGITDDPQNWFMSRSGDPLDWDYGATPDATMAVAGNNSIAGLVGDRITCLAPYNDDLMIMGGDHTIWMMRGDPAENGHIDNVSSSTGIAGPDAICFDPMSTAYFFGDGIFYRWPVTGQPEPLSRGRMDKTFSAFNLATSNIRLLWDDLQHGVHIYVTLIGAGQNTHYFWDARTDSFWKDVYPDDVGPTAVHLFDSNALDDRALLLGGKDGYVRKVDPTTNGDDGISIPSRVKYAPINQGGLIANTRMTKMIVRLADDSDPVTLNIYAAESPQAVVAASTPAWSTVVSPRSAYASTRVSGNSLLPEIVNPALVGWAAATAYVVGDLILGSDGHPYSALFAHTSTITKTWAAGTIFTIGDVVIVSAVAYQCIVTHTATTGGAHPTPPGNTTDWAVSPVGSHPTPPANSTDWTQAIFRTWAIEDIMVYMEPSGTTRHGRL